MTSLLFVTRFTPSEVGHGGDHRAYQIVHDLEQVAGGRVIVVTAPILWWQAEFSGSRPAQSRPGRQWDRSRAFVLRKRRRMHIYGENPLKLLADTGYTTHGYSLSTFEADYARLAGTAPAPAVCVLEHTGFANLIPINTRYGLPTIACPANLDSLDWERAGPPSGPGRYSMAVDWANEVGVLARCAERLFVSRVEAGLIGGLGLASHYYPYLPVGKIEEHLQQIRRERTTRQPEAGLFLMLGSSMHATTRASFQWFIEAAQTGGLPAGARVIVGGTETETLRPRGADAPGLEFHGWLAPDALEALLARVQAVLVPQRLGFGALTRLSELACAGVPAVVSRHATYALDLPPGITAVDDCWEDWRRAMERTETPNPAGAEAEYAAWAARQPRPLAAAIARVLDGGARC
jgi:hypothetical protein